MSFSRKVYISLVIKVFHLLCLFCSLSIFILWEIGAVYVSLSGIEVVRAKDESHYVKSESSRSGEFSVKSRFSQMQKNVVKC